MKLSKVLYVILLFAALPAHAQTSKTVRYLSKTLTVDTNAYATGENIGGKLTFEASPCGASETFSVQSIQIADKSGNAVSYDVLLFSENPSATTFTDQAALDVADADLAKIVFPINILAADCFAFADNGICSLSSLDSGGYLVNNSTTLYGALVSRGTPTYASASDVSLLLGIKCN